MRRAPFALLVLGLLLAGCQETLYSGLDEAEANRMRQALLRQGIASDKRVAEDGRYKLDVARDDIGPALRALEAAGLPRHRFADPMQLIRSDALVASPAEDRARLGYALSQELAATLSTIDGVVGARVHLVLPERSPLGTAKAAPPSASVLVRHRPGHNLQALSLSIRQLVARGVEGLAPEQVSVTLVAAEPVATEAAAPLATAPHREAGALPGFALGLLAGALLALAPWPPAARRWLQQRAQALRPLPVPWRR